MGSTEGVLFYAAVDDQRPNPDRGHLPVGARGRPTAP